MRYAALDGGKRLRPMLVLAASELGGAVADAVGQAMAAIEMIHVYSLVHDDMPAMDNDSLRRGKPTCHIKYGEATALLTGDALQTQAFDVLSRPTELPAARQLAMLSVLAKAGGSAGMAGGQAIDLANVGKQMVQADLERMHSLKTGALIRAAVYWGRRRVPICPTRNLPYWTLTRQNWVWRSKSSTMCWIVKRTRRLWARRRAKMPTTTSRLM